MEQNGGRKKELAARIEHRRRMANGLRSIESQLEPRERAKIEPLVSELERCGRFSGRTTDWRHGLRPRFHRCNRPLCPVCADRWRRKRVEAITEWLATVPGHGAWIGNFVVEAPPTAITLHWWLKQRKAVVSLFRRANAGKAARVWSDQWLSAGLRRYEIRWLLRSPAPAHDVFEHAAGLFQRVVPQWQKFLYSPLQPLETVGLDRFLNLALADGEWLEEAHWLMRSGYKHRFAAAKHYTEALKKLQHAEATLGKSQVPRLKRTDELDAMDWQTVALCGPDHPGFRFVERVAEVYRENAEKNASAPVREVARNIDCWITIGDELRESGNLDKMTVRAAVEALWEGHTTRARKKVKQLAEAIDAKRAIYLANNAVDGDECG